MNSKISQLIADQSLAPRDPQMLLRIRHTCAHVLAMSVQAFFLKPRWQLALDTKGWNYT
jgi:threonyl-tRNA synthetase